MKKGKQKTTADQTPGTSPDGTVVYRRAAGERNGAGSGRRRVNGRVG